MAVHLGNDVCVWTTLHFNASLIIALYSLSHHWIKMYISCQCTHPHDNVIISVQVSDLLSVLQAGSRGVEACIEAIQELSGVISEIETNIYFVSAGSLLPDDGNDTFAKHRSEIHTDFLHSYHPSLSLSLSLFLLLYR